MCVCTYKGTCVRAHGHAYIHTSTHANPHMSIRHVYTPVSTHMNTVMGVSMCVLARIHKNTHVRAHT